MILLAQNMNLMILVPLLETSDHSLWMIFRQPTLLLTVLGM